MSRLTEGGGVDRDENQEGSRGATIAGHLHMMMHLCRVRNMEWMMCIDVQGRVYLPRERGERRGGKERGGGGGTAGREKGGLQPVRKRYSGEGLQKSTSRFGLASGGGVCD
jgi:hypothetical protein